MGKKPIIRVAKFILTKKMFLIITSYCTNKVPNVHLQQELNQSRNQVQSKVNQGKGRNKIHNLLEVVNKEAINQKKNQ